MAMMFGRGRRGVTGSRWRPPWAVVNVGAARGLGAVPLESAVVWTTRWVTLLAVVDATVGLVAHGAMPRRRPGVGNRLRRPTFYPSELRARPFGINNLRNRPNHCQPFLPAESRADPALAPVVRLQASRMRWPHAPLAYYGSGTPASMRVHASAPFTIWLRSRPPSRRGGRCRERGVNDSHLRRRLRLPVAAQRRVRRRGGAAGTTKENPCEPSPLSLHSSRSSP